MRTPIVGGPAEPARARSRRLPPTGRRAAATAAALALILSLPRSGAAQTPDRVTGPVIDEFGGVFQVDGLDLPVDTERPYRVVFEVYDAPDSPAELNPDINTLARFLNMHAREGVPPDRMELALVLHGPAGKAALSHAAYRKRYGDDNPNLGLLEALADAGVPIYLCGQTAASRGLLPSSDLAEPVDLVLSAMTMLVTLQADGHQLIAF